MQCPSRETEDEMLCLVRSEHKHKAQATTKCCSASDDTLMTVRMNVPRPAQVNSGTSSGQARYASLRDMADTVNTRCSLPVSIHDAVNTDVAIL
jgi:hypothetical protein